MLVTQSFVFIHLTRCAGTFLESVLIEHDGPVRYRGRFHGAWRELPRRSRSLPVLAFVRNPWDWWVSWYEHVKQAGWHHHPVTRVAAAAGDTSFGGVLAFFARAIRKLDEVVAHFADRASEGEIRRICDSHIRAGTLAQYRHQIICNANDPGYWTFLRDEGAALSSGDLGRGPRAPAAPAEVHS